MNVEYQMTITETSEDGISTSTDMGIIDFFNMLYKSATKRPYVARQDFYAENGQTVIALTGDEGFTIFVPEPVKGKFIRIEIAKMEGKGKLHIKVKSSKDIKIAGSTDYVIEESGTGVILVSLGEDYVKFQ